MKFVREFLQNTLLGGVLIVLPIYLAIVVLLKGMQSVVPLVRPFTMLLPDWVPAENLLSLVLVLIVCCLIGAAVRTRLGHMLRERMETSLFERLPGYGLFRSLTQRLAGEGRENVWKPALADMGDGLVPVFIIEEFEDGRFTVIAEGDETVFGPDGGRDNAALGLIEARFRRELPQHNRRVDMPPMISFPTSPMPGQDVPRPPSRFPFEPFTTSAYRTLQPAAPSMPSQSGDTIERAAGTGLSGHSDQRFVPIQLGSLEDEATVIQLRIVIGTEAALAEDAVRPLADRAAPLRPAPRP